VIGSKEHFEKLKRYWLENNRQDYLVKLHALRIDFDDETSGAKSIDTEIRLVSKAYKRFLRWTKSKEAEALLEEKRKSK
jgi:hypothetical protein